MVAVRLGIDPDTVGQWRRRFTVIVRALETVKIPISRCLRSAGQYSPPERAVVLYVDEKSQIQALDRSH